MLYDINKPDLLADDAVMGVDGREREADRIGQPGTVDQDAVPDAARGAIIFAVRPLKETVILFEEATLCILASNVSQGITDPLRCHLGFW